LTGRNIYTEAFWWLFSLLACIGAATLFWLLIERPSARLAKQFGEKFTIHRLEMHPCAQPSPSRD